MRYARLWGGAADGHRVAIGDGEAPAQLAVYRTPAGELVPIRARVLTPAMDAEADTYVRVTATLYQAGLRAGVQPLPVGTDWLLYAHRDVAVRWEQTP